MVETAAGMTSKRVLVVHNFYRSENASGENLSVQDEVAALRDAGWEVELLRTDSDAITNGDLSLAGLAVRPVYSRRSVRRTADAIERFRPHVALVENLFPLHSPWVLRTLQRAGVPVAAGVRSYRMWCAASTMYRDGSYCNDCVGSLVNLPAVRHGCYQHSPARTLPLAASLALHRPAFNRIDAFLAVTDFVAAELTGAGMPADRVVVRPNFVDDPVPGGEQSPGSGFVFAGRLSPEKGVDLMLAAWQASEVWRTSTLRIAGTGELREAIDRLDPVYRVETLGLVDHERLMGIIGSSAVMVVPSVWPEPFGRGVIEAAACGRPSLVADSGGLPALVANGVTGWVAQAGVEQFAAGFRLAADETSQRTMGAAARRRYLDRWTRAVSIGILDETLTRLAERGTDLAG